jgi:acetylornithine deacetylase/succinyl-diaminopimelate desuccinylase-like protein
MAYMLIAALVIAGWVVVYVSSRRALRRTREELRLEFQRRIEALSANVTALERTAAGATQKAEEINSETLATIAETIAALLGRKVHIRSVKILETPSAVSNPWAQQGRVIVQASHNVAQRGRE